MAKEQVARGTGGITTPPATPHWAVSSGAGYRFGRACGTSGHGPLAQGSAEEVKQ